MNKGVFSGSHWAMALLFLGTLSLQAHFSEARFKDRVIIPECPWCDVRAVDAEDFVYLPLQERVMRLFAPADPDFLADLLWLRTSYYFGFQGLTTRNYPYLFNLLDLITDLAPRWEGPFLFGAAILPTEANSLEDGLYMIEKGLVFHPDVWRLWFFKGFYHWQSLEDYETASKALLEAAKLPKAPIYVGLMSATLATRTGRRDFASRFIEEALQVLHDEKQREILMQKMRELYDDD
jgi:tetratricopeptide (TPR) repeat protein